MNLIGNLLWLILGGFLIAVEYFVASILLMVTIIGIPFGLQTLKLASLALWPMGRDSVYIEQPAGCVTTILNLIWLLIGGFWIALSHLALGILLSLTIIGLPFGMQHFKMAVLALMPFGKTVRFFD
ncbi:MAG TPA: YccF domain-containing protein [Bacteroidales bacterium]|nr:YccF domain-containing protein [Bacteroidales bacterium]